MINGLEKKPAVQKSKNQDSGKGAMEQDQNDASSSCCRGKN
jgi:hypothetical protein